jgi:hypothetical protein
MLDIIKVLQSENEKLSVENVKLRKANMYTGDLLDQALQTIRKCKVFVNHWSYENHLDSADRREMFRKEAKSLFE